MHLLKLPKIKMLNNTNKANIISIFFELVLFVIGLSLLIFFNHNISDSIGSSLVATSITLFLNTTLVSWKKKDPLSEWGLKRIYQFRHKKGTETDDLIKKIKYKFDIIAFGLRSLRDRKSEDFEDVLKKGVNIRIITMDPESELIKCRENEEGVGEGHIKKSIKDLIEWAKELNKKNFKGKIYIKGYKCMTLDFYYRIDDEIYVGPYWFGIESQQTITFKFESEKMGFETYEKYFEKLWDSKDEKFFRILLNG